MKFEPTYNAFLVVFRYAATFFLLHHLLWSFIIYLAFWVNAGSVLFAEGFGMKANLKPIIETRHVCLNCSSMNLFIDQKPPEIARYTCLKSHWSLHPFGGFCKWKLSSLVTFSVRNKDLCSNLGYSLQVSSAFVPNQFHFCCRDILLWKFGSGFSARPSIYSSAPGIMAKDVSIL